MKRILYSHSDGSLPGASNYIKIDKVYRNAEYVPGFTKWIESYGGKFEPDDTDDALSYFRTPVFITFENDEDATFFKIITSI